MIGIQFSPVKWVMMLFEARSYAEGGQTAMAKGYYRHECLSNVGTRMESDFNFAITSGPGESLNRARIVLRVISG